ncbi:MAG: BON domain-containing protein [Candidatus Binatia bacterium]
MVGMKVVLGILALGAFSAALFACGSSDEPGTAAQPIKRPMGVGNTTMANSELEKAVRDNLNSNEQLRAADLAVSADVTKNEVTLSGTVSSEELRAKAVELAKGAHAGVIVTDRINVKPSPSNPVPPSA